MSLVARLFESRSPNQIILLASLWLTLFTNASYYSQVLRVYEADLTGFGFLASIALLQFALVVILLCLFSTKFLLKPWSMLMLLSAAGSAYFMDSFGIVIDQDMINNALQTNSSEALDLVSVNLFTYLVLLGVLPAAWVFRTPLRWRPFWHETRSRLKLVGFALLLMVLCIALFSKHYASFFREHKQARLYSNPIYMVYSAVKTVTGNFTDNQSELARIGLDAQIPIGDEDRELIIFVVGETARADHFSLNGYSRQTNPLLAKKDLFNFTRMTSCATSTATSVPCMFSLLPQGDFSTGAARQTENVLDILNRAGVNILWRDNNSSSKGVADRVEYQDFRDPKNNPVCNPECRDEGMLAGLEDYIDAHPQGDILIVLHQMGNHGPAYFKRYPPEFEVFTPVCKTVQLEDCSDEEIINAYDNAILYTDYFLAKTIEFLEEKSDQFETGLIYASDHGESLGESGLYLHGLPNFMAPETQTHVPALLWLGDSYEHVDRQALRTKSTFPLSHDNLFHTLLGLFEIEIPERDADMDILSGSW